MAGVVNPSHISPAPTARYTHVTVRGCRVTSHLLGMHRTPIVVVWEAAGSNPCAGPSLVALQLARRESPVFVPPVCKPIDASQPLWWRVYAK
jgi:hypothetical protein